MKYTSKDFQKEFPTNDKCLEWLFNYRYPEGVHCVVCDKVTKHHKIAKRPCYKCDNCGHEIYPLAGTIFHKSATPLKTWFDAMYWMSTTRSGRSAKELQRMTGVTYKTAWRMFKQIRTLLDETSQPLAGTVELDETFVGGKAHNMHKSKRAKLGGRGTAGKTVVFGAVERKGNVVAQKVANTDKFTLIPEIQEHVAPNTTVYTDELSSYEPLNRIGYNHEIVNHTDKIYVRGNVHTNTIEGFWSLVKRGISGVYHSVSPKYLQSYVNEYSFRYNHRKDETPMVRLMMNRI